MKIFAISDMHSYLTPTLSALKDAGWDENNPEHIIVVCGDALDRGNETAEMVEWLIDLINKGKLIYVCGNHDILMQEMLNRGYSMSHDKHNGTQKSYYQILNAYSNMMDGRKPDDIVREVLQPLYDKMVNYFESERYIFVHSFIPLHKVGYDKYEYREDWRNATDEEFEIAMWGNPFFYAQDGLNQTGKTIIAGHWHCSLGHVIDSDGELTEFGDDACWDIYKNEDWKFIGIDRCTAHTGKVNVLILEDDFLE
jgi:predicted MPP superfamily phosphohydrolase